MIDYKKTSILMLLLFVIAAAILLLGVFGCISREIKQKPGELVSCYHFRVVTSISQKSTGIVSKETTTSAVALNLATQAMTKCWTKTEEAQKAIQALKDDKRFEDCKTLIYGEKIESKKENKSKYIDFIECRERSPCRE